MPKRRTIVKGRPPSPCPGVPPYSLVVTPPPWSQGNDVITGLPAPVNPTGGTLVRLDPVGPCAWNGSLILGTDILQFSVNLIPAFGPLPAHWLLSGFWNLTAISTWENFDSSVAQGDYVTTEPNTLPPTMHLRRA